MRQVEIIKTLNLKIYIRFSKNLAKEVRKKTQSFEKNVKHFETNITNYHNDL